MQLEPVNLIAIDPGVNGAYAILNLMGEFIFADELPRFSKTVNDSEFAKIVKSHNLGLGIIEQVGAMPKQGVASTFVFGTAYGMIRGILAGCQVPYVMVTPVMWKRHFRLLGKPKEASLELAARLYPQAKLVLKKHVGRADAILLARYHLDQAKGARFT